LQLADLPVIVGEVGPEPLYQHLVSCGRDALERAAHLLLLQGRLEEEWRRLHGVYTALTWW
jgi:hypothetical protein